MSNSMGNKDMQDAVTKLVDTFHEWDFSAEDILTVLMFTQAMYMAQGVEYTIDQQGHSDNLDTLIKSVSELTEKNMYKTLTFIMEQEQNIRLTMH